MGIAVIGGGPAGLMAAETAVSKGERVEVYDALASIGRKFLLAGKGGLNLTHAEPDESFFARYGDRRANLQPVLAKFGSSDVRQWAHGLGIQTFVGSSGRVFPSDLKSAPLLRAWLRRLRQAGVTFHVRHRWEGWEETGALRFTTPSGNRVIHADAVILALGGASWPRFGSDGRWASILAERGVPVQPLRPANCGFDVKWSEHIRSRFAGHPVKSVVVSGKTPDGGEFRQQGEFVITENGIEGGVIYALSAWLRDEIQMKGTATIRLDLAPDRERSRLLQDLQRARGSRSVASHLRRRAGIEGVKAALMREFMSKGDFTDPVLLVNGIKDLSFTLVAPRPLEEAISTAGGIAFEALDDHLMVRLLPGLFCAGEMLDWEAPTGGYLITACLASGFAAGLGAAGWLSSLRKYNDTAPYLA